MADPIVVSDEKQERLVIKAPGQGHGTRRCRQPKLVDLIKTTPFMHLLPPLFLPQLPTLHGFNKLRSQKSVDCTVAAAALFTDIIIFPQG